MNKELLRKYAKLAVCSGVNVQPGQKLIINAPVKEYEFVKMCVEEAYKVKAGEVVIEWNDETLSKLHYENCSLETLCEVPDWEHDKVAWFQDGGCCRLSISSNTPGFLKDVDPVKLRESRKAYNQKMHDLHDYYMSNHGQWSVVALPTVGWAKQVFPKLSDEDACDKLLETILETVHVKEDNDPIVAWQQHDADLRHYCDVLNAHQFEKLHFTNSLGTDLYVGLVKDHIWVGGSCFNDNGVEFNPNMPTEECFCMPHKDHVEGKVVASKPLSYGGTLLKNFWFEFKNGRVVNHGAEEGYDVLTELLNTDEGSRHIGEVALISYNSPISLLDIVFYNTLFDENASCHLALGACYPENLKGGIDMSRDEVLAHGGNDSFNHVDFMFGTSDMSVVGIKENGEEVPVFVNGNFVF